MRKDYIFKDIDPISFWRNESIWLWLDGANHSGYDSKKDSDALRSRCVQNNEGWYIQRFMADGNPFEGQNNHSARIEFCQQPKKSPVTRVGKGKRFRYEVDFTLGDDEIRSIIFQVSHSSLDMKRREVPLAQWECLSDAIVFRERKPSHPKYRLHRHKVKPYVKNSRHVGVMVIDFEKETLDAYLDGERVFSKSGDLTTIRGGYLNFSFGLYGDGAGNEAIQYNRLSYGDDYSFDKITKPEPEPQEEEEEVETVVEKLDGILEKLDRLTELLSINAL
jgi:hypothetical protein